MSTRITNLRSERALQQDRDRGLLYWVSFEHGAHIFDGIALRRTARGSYTLSYPERRDSAGHPHPIVRPLDQAARDAITEQVVAELRRQGVLP